MTKEVKAITEELYSNYGMFITDSCFISDAVNRSFAKNYNIVETLNETYIEISNKIISDDLEKNNFYDNFVNSYNLIGLEKTFENVNKVLSIRTDNDITDKSFMMIVGTLEFEDFYNEKLSGILTENEMYDFRLLKNSFLSRVLSMYTLTRKSCNDVDLETLLTDVSDNNFRLYLRDILQFQILSEEQEKELFIRYAKTGDKDIKEQIAEHNLRLVLNTTKYFKNRGLEMEDLVQEGNLGLLKAIDKYDVKRGFRFSTMAIYWIKQMILKAIRTKSKTIKIPEYKFNSIYKINKIKEQLRNDLGREPTITEIASALGDTPENLEEKYFIPYSMTFIESLNENIGDDEEDSIDRMSSIESDGLKNLYDDIDARYYREYTDEFLQKIKYVLTPSQYNTYIEVLKTWNGKKFSFTKAAKKLNRTKAAVRQLYLVTFEKIKEQRELIDNSTLFKLKNRSIILNSYQYKLLTRKVSSETCQIIKDNSLSLSLARVLPVVPDDRDLYFDIFLHCGCCGNTFRVKHLDFVNNPKLHECIKEKTVMPELDMVIEKKDERNINNFMRLNKNYGKNDSSSQITTLSNNGGVHLYHCSRCSSEWEMNSRIFKLFNECPNCIREDLKMHINGDKYKKTYDLYERLNRLRTTLFYKSLSKTLDERRIFTIFLAYGIGFDPYSYEEISRIFSINKRTFSSVLVDLVNKYGPYINYVLQEEYEFSKGQDYVRIKKQEK